MHLDGRLDDNINCTSVSTTDYANIGTNLNVGTNTTIQGNLYVNGTINSANLFTPILNSKIRIATQDFFEFTIPVDRQEEPIIQEPIPEMPLPKELRPILSNSEGCAYRVLYSGMKITASDISADDPQPHFFDGVIWCYFDRNVTIPYFSSPTLNIIEGSYPTAGDTTRTLRLYNSELERFSFGQLYIQRII